jgi:hypothetical protein
VVVGLAANQSTRPYVDWWLGRSRSALFAAGRHAVFTGGLAHGVCPSRTRHAGTVG